MKRIQKLILLTLASFGLVVGFDAQAQDKKPNILMLMEDDTGWSDFGCYLGGKALGHPTPHVDRMAKEGAMFTCWYGQASCTAGRASFITGRIPIRSALSIVVAPGDRELAAQGNADHRGVLQEERLPRPTSRANGISATNRTAYPDRAWLR